VYVTRLGCGSGGLPPLVGRLVRSRIVRLDRDHASKREKSNSSHAREKIYVV